MILLHILVTKCDNTHWQTSDKDYYKQMVSDSQLLPAKYISKIYYTFLSTEANIQSQTWI